MARTPGDYEKVYGRILEQAREPVILHWLGNMFDPALAGYWNGSDAQRAGGRHDVQRAMDTVLGIIRAHAGKVDGVKISLLDKDKEIEMRRRLPAGVRMYTGDAGRAPRFLGRSPLVVDQHRDGTQELRHRAAAAGDPGGMRPPRHSCHLAMA